MDRHPLVYFRVHYDLLADARRTPQTADLQAASPADARERMLARAKAQSQRIHIHKTKVIREGAPC
ncbi:hypothetical protein XM25_19750 [Devosia sp. H5989]|nr:hypothetical protein XM25_19750 [Devosia sp. H5989]